MKHAHCEFHIDTISDCKVIRSKKCENLSLGQNLLLDHNLLAAQFFLFINILFMLQELLLI